MDDPYLIHAFDSVRWLDLHGDTPDHWRACLIKEKIHLPDSLIQRTEWPEIHEFEDGSAMVSMHFPTLDEKGRLHSNIELKILIGLDCVITMHTGALPALDAVRQTIGTAALPQNASSSMLVCRILIAQVNTRFTILDRLNLECTRLEDMVFAHQGGRDFIGDLMRLRKSITTLSRIVIPQREVISELADHLRAICPPDAEQCIRDSALVTRVHARIGHVHTQLVSLREKSEHITEANEAFLSHSLNRTLKHLTGVSVIVVPPTLVTGIWGMNTAVPGQDTLLGFVLVILLLIAVSILTTWFFRRSHWL